MGRKDEKELWRTELEKEREIRKEIKKRGIRKLPCIKNKHIQKVNKFYLFRFLIA